MNYREKQKKTAEDRKLRKISQFRKRYAGTAAENLAGCLEWEERANREIEEYRGNNDLLPKPGDELYLTGFAGAAGTLFLADWKREQLLTRFPEAFIRTAEDRDVFSGFSTKDTAENWLLPDSFLERQASWIAPVGEGGLMKTFYRFGKETDLGFRVQSKEVPIRQITVEFCEFFLLHPWELLTGNSFLFSAEHSAPVIRFLEEQGIPCRRIGTVTKEKQKLICRGEDESNINRPEPDGLLNLLLEEQNR